MRPVRGVALGGGPEIYTLGYNTSTYEIVQNTSKTFVVQHPQREDHYLVHACLEGPEAGVYYRGKGCIDACCFSTQICLPSYAHKIATDFAVQVSAITDSDPEAGDPDPEAGFPDPEAGDPDFVPTFAVGPVIDGCFTVYGKGGVNGTMFSWLAIGTRQKIKVEVPKDSCTLQNVGPYTWITDV